MISNNGLIAWVNKSILSHPPYFSLWVRYVYVVTREGIALSDACPDESSCPRGLLKEGIGRKKASVKDLGMGELKRAGLLIKSKVGDGYGFEQPKKGKLSIAAIMTYILCHANSSETDYRQIKSTVRSNVDY